MRQLLIALIFLFSSLIAETPGTGRNLRQTGKTVISTEIQVRIIIPAKKISTKDHRIDSTTAYPKK